MSKAVLVIDMPKSCGECSICASWQESAFSAREYWCPVMDNKDVEPNKKPEWCPLKEVPRKLEREIVKEDYNGGYSHGIVHGYNACIDEILKGSERRMRLIDASSFKNFIESLPKNPNGTSRAYDEATILRFIDAQPTAYEVEKVVAELEEWTYKADVIMPRGDIVKNVKLISSGSAIDIVRKGGVESGK